MTNLIHQWTQASTHSLTADWIVVGIFAVAFAILGIVGRNVWGGLRRPIIQDQPEHWGDDLPWPLADLGPGAKGSAEAVLGGQSHSVGFPNSLVDGEVTNS